MKIQHVRDSLNEIKSEDLMIIEELNKTIRELEIDLNRRYTEIETIEIKKSIMNNIKNIKGSKRLMFRFFSPLIEMIVIAASTIGIVTSPLMLSEIVIFLLLGILGLSAHTIYIIRDEFLKVADKNESIANIIISALCNIMDKKVNIENKILSYLHREEELNVEIKQLEETMSQSRVRKDKLSDEISYIEGNLHGVECLINKYSFKEIDNENSVVQFIEEKNEYKKRLVSPLKGY